MTELALPDIDAPDQVSVEWLKADSDICFITFVPTGNSIYITLTAPAARSLRDQLDSHIKELDA